MSKSLRSIKDNAERAAAIARRLASNTRGLGYWAAVDAQAILDRAITTNAFSDRVYAYKGKKPNAPRDR